MIYLICFKKVNFVCNYDYVAELFVNYTDIF